MSTRYWLNTLMNGDDTNPDNYDELPQIGDDITFDSTRSGYYGPASGDGGNNGLAGMVFGTISILDGSIIGSAFACDTLYLTNYSVAACNCNVLNAGADGSECSYAGTASEVASFYGQSQNVGNLGGAVSFHDYSQNDNGITVDSAAFTDNSQNNNSVQASAVSFNSDAANNDTVIAGTILFVSGATNPGSLYGSVSFNNASSNSYGTAFGIVSFHDSSNNDGGTVNGVASFDASASNQGFVYGVAYYASPAAPQPGDSISGPVSTTPIIPPAANVQSGFSYGVNGSQLGTLAAGTRAYSNGGSSGY